MADGNRTSLCKLWKKTSGAGNDYLVGRMGGARVLLFFNDRKSGDSEHDAEIFVVPYEPPRDPEPRQRPITRERTAELGLPDHPLKGAR
ncbi:MAG: hypothetical protein AAGI03_02740 [Pseudomonadota bacterium]